MINDFEKYIVSLEFFQEKSYSIIYNDRILVYSLEGYKPDEAMFEAASKDYISLAVKLMGKRFHKQLIKFFGEEETLYFYLLEYWNSKIENDEIKRASIKSMTESEDTTDEGLTT